MYPACHVGFIVNDDPVWGVLHLVPVVSITDVSEDVICSIFSTDLSRDKIFLVDISMNADR
jgi:hypothetical protein